LTCGWINPRDLWTDVAQQHLIALGAAGRTINQLAASVEMARGAFYEPSDRRPTERQTSAAVRAYQLPDHPRHAPNLADDHAKAAPR
jgi:hypothetical protein